MKSRPLSRRTFLRGCGVALGLPLLEGMTPPVRAANGPSEEARRMVLIGMPLGLHAPFLFPKESGPAYTPTPYLEILKEFRSQLTLFSGLSHPGVGGGHSSIASLLTGAPGTGSRAFRNTISIDQRAAEHLGSKTRFPSLTLSGVKSNESLSWTRSGVLIPSLADPVKVYSTLFLEGSKDQVQHHVDRLADGRSLLDMVLGNSRGFSRDLGTQDREKLEEYFSAVRELERELRRAQEWTKKPKPKVNVPPPHVSESNRDVLENMRLMLDMAHLALQTDSTRVITVYCAGDIVPRVDAVTLGYHDLSHHGNDPEKLEQLHRVQSRLMETLRDFLGKLNGTGEAGASLLDRTMVFLGSNLGDASYHSTQKLPVMLAGGRFQHGQHVAFDPEKHPPLSNLYVTMLQQLGLPVDSFGTSTGALKW